MHVKHLTVKEISVIAIFSVLVWVLCLLGIAVLSQYEGDLFPVVSPFEIKNIRTENEMVVVDLHFHKLRDCNPKTMAWFYGNQALDRVGNIQIKSEIRSGFRIHDEGPHVIKDVVLDLTEDELKNNSYAYVYHDCHNDWLWNTRTLAYTSNN